MTGALHSLTKILGAEILRSSSYNANLHSNLHRTSTLAIKLKAHDTQDQIKLKNNNVHLIVNGNACW